MQRTLKEMHTVCGFYRKEEGTIFQKMKKNAGNHNSRRKTQSGVLKSWMEERLGTVTNTYLLLSDFYYAQKKKKIYFREFRLNGTTSSSYLSSISILLSHPSKNNTGHPRCWLATQIQKINNTLFNLIHFSQTWENFLPCSLHSIHFLASRPNQPEAAMEKNITEIYSQFQSQDFTQTNWVYSSTLYESYSKTPHTHPSSNTT